MDTRTITATIVTSAAQAGDEAATDDTLVSTMMIGMATSSTATPEPSENRASLKEKPATPESRWSALRVHRRPGPS